MQTEMDDYKMIRLMGDGIMSSATFIFTLTFLSIDDFGSNHSIAIQISIDREK
jgi:hypothetical protein